MNLHHIRSFIFGQRVRLPMDTYNAIKQENDDALKVTIAALEVALGERKDNVMPFRRILPMIVLLLVSACDDGATGAQKTGAAHTKAERGLVYSEELGAWMIPGDHIADAGKMVSEDWGQLVEVDDDLIAFLKKHEGFKSRPYRCSAGVWTIGYGHVIQPGERFRSVSEAQAEALLIQDIQKAEAAVNKLVKVRLSDNQRAALVSFAFNVGTGAFRDSTLLKRINAADGHGALVEMAKWIHANGKRSAGLKARRLGEMELFVASN